MTECRGCGETALSRVLDLGKVPAADHFPLATDPVRADEASHALAMDVCRACGLAQLADDDTVTDEPRGVEPQALKDQAEAAIERVDGGGLAAGGHRPRIRQPARWHVDPAAYRAWVHYSDVAADVVLDCFGIMHEPDQRSAFARRAQVTAPAGCCCCNTTRSSRSSNRASGMRCGTGISPTTR